MVQTVKGSPTISTRLFVVTPLQSQDEFEASQGSGSGSESGAIICPGCEHCDFAESELVNVFV